jgi:hypothetical protein
MHSSPVKYVILIEAGGSMVARLFDARRVHISDVDGASEDVVIMTDGVTPEHAGTRPEWAPALAGHNDTERAAAQLYTLPV